MGTKDSKDNVKITKGNCNLRIDLQRGMKISGCSSVVELSAISMSNQRRKRNCSQKERRAKCTISEFFIGAIALWILWQRIEHKWKRFCGERIKVQLTKMGSLSQNGNCSFTRSMTSHVSTLFYCLHRPRVWSVSS